MQVNTKVRILEQALSLFSLRGYEAVGIQEIVKKSGVGKPTLYYYFGNKEGLLKAVLEAHFPGLIELVRSALEYRGELLFTLEQCCRRVFEYAGKNRDFYRMYLSMSCDPPESTAYKAVFPYGEKIFGLLEELFEKASADHGNMRGRQMRYALSFTGLINTYATFFLNGHLSIDDELIHGVVHQYIHGILS